MNIDSYFECGVSDYKNNRLDKELLYNSSMRVSIPYTHGRHYASWLEYKGLLTYPIEPALVNQARQENIFI
jgi:hypothetical protein